MFQHLWLRDSFIEGGGLNGTLLVAQCLQVGEAMSRLSPAPGSPVPQPAWPHAAHSWPSSCHLFARRWLRDGSFLNFGNHV